MLNSWMAAQFEKVEEHWKAAEAFSNSWVLI